MGAESEDGAFSKVPGQQSGLDRALERTAILAGKGVGFLAIGVGVYLVLIAYFFLCCGTDVLAWVHPQKSPLGPVVTVVLVWPLVGLLCVVSGGALDGGLRATWRRVHGSKGGR